MRPAQCVSVRNTPLQWAPGWGARTCGPRKAGFSLLSTTPSPHQGQPLPCHPTARTALAFSTPYTDGLIQYNPLGVAFCSLEGHPCHHSARVFNLFIPIAVRYSTVKTPLFTHFIVDRHLGFHFQFGAVINSPCTHIYYRLLIHAAKLFLWRYRNLYSCP